MFPYGYGSSSVELPQRQLHVKERHTTEDGHQNVGNEESTCTGTHKAACHAGLLHEGHDECFCCLVHNDNVRTFII